MTSIMDTPTTQQEIITSEMISDQQPPPELPVIRATPAIPKNHKTSTPSLKRPCQRHW